MSSSSPVHSSPSTGVGATRPAYQDRRRLVERLQDVLTAVFIAFLAQLLIAGTQLGLDQGKSDFPAPILAMAGVFLVFSIGGCAIPELEEFYRKRLKRATELLNRHMSIGFTIPVVMLCRGPFSDTHSIGMIIVGFVLTGLFNTVSAYFLALPIQCLMVRHDKQFWVDGHADLEKGEAQQKPHKPAKSFCEGSPTGSSLTVGVDSSSESPSGGDATQELPMAGHPQINCPSLQARLRIFALCNPTLLLCWFSTISLGVPLRCTLHYDVPLATTLLFSIWLTTLTVQTAIKSTPYLARWPRTLLASLSNSVLWTALAMIAYIFTDASLSHRPLDSMLDTLQMRTPLSTLLLLHASPSSLPPQTTTTTTKSMAAGDLATTLLNSGLVAWGLKLYEHRSHLLSRAGLTVCTVSALLALGNVACGPLLAHALGVAPASRALAFAARSVTIALAGPVMGMMGGDGGLGAAMVVGSGIVYQMGMGFGVGGWLEGRVLRGLGRGCKVRGDGGGGGGNAEVDGERLRGVETGMVQDQQPQQQPRGREGGGGDTGTDTDTETRERARTRTETSGEAGRSAAVTPARRQTSNDPRTVAAGVTVGVNAAAMGTAYLYEVQSEAAPYAALSMIALGVMTVVFSSISPLAQWVVERVGA